MLQLAGYQAWMEEALEPNQVWIELRCYSGYGHAAAQALREAFAAAGIAEQLLDVIVSPMERASPADQNPADQNPSDQALADQDPALRSRSWQFIGTIMARVEKTDESAAVLRSGTSDYGGLSSGDQPYSGWQFARNLSRARASNDPAVASAGEVPAGTSGAAPYKIWDWVRVLTWPFEGVIGRVSSVNKFKGQVMVVVFTAGPLDLGLDEIERLPEAPKRAWYVLYGYPGKEGMLRDRLRERLLKAGLLYRLYEIVIPGQGEKTVRLVKDGQAQTIYPSQFPGSVFALISLDEATWDVVRQTPGLTGFVGQGNKPLGYPSAQPPEPGEAAGLPVQPGDRVRILSGPYQNSRATVVEVDAGRAKVQVMVDFPGQPVSAELDLGQVVKE